MRETETGEQEGRGRGARGTLEILAPGDRIGIAQRLKSPDDRRPLPSVGPDTIGRETGATPSSFASTLFADRTTKPSPYLPESNGSLIGADEVERSALSAIVRSLARHDDSAVPKIPFSMCLLAWCYEEIDGDSPEGRSTREGGVAQWTSET